MRGSDAQYQAVMWSTENLVRVLKLYDLGYDMECADFSRILSACVIPSLVASRLKYKRHSKIQ